MNQIKKTFLTLLLALPLISFTSAFANLDHLDDDLEETQAPAPRKPDRRHHRKQGIHGKKAMAVYNALNIEAKEIAKKDLTINIKNIGGLICLSKTHAEKEKVKYSCFFKKAHRKPEFN